MIDDDHGRACDIDIVAAIGEPALDDVEADLRAGAERRAHLLLERRVGGEDDHSGPDARSCGVGRYA